MKTAPQVKADFAHIALPNSKLVRAFGVLVAAIAMGEYGSHTGISLDASAP